MSGKRFLKVKLKSLAAEARIIRKEEGKTHGQLRENLHSHRVFVVRRECRATHLAYGFLRGRSYGQLERNPRTVPDWERVNRMVKKYGCQELSEDWPKAA